MFIVNLLTFQAELDNSTMLHESDDSNKDDNDNDNEAKDPSYMEGGVQSDAPSDEDNCAHWFDGIKNDLNFLCKDGIFQKTECCFSSDLSTLPLIGDMPEKRSRGVEVNGAKVYDEGDERTTRWSIAVGARKSEAAASIRVGCNRMAVFT